MVERALCDHLEHAPGLARTMGGLGGLRCAIPWKSSNPPLPTRSLSRIASLSNEMAPNPLAAIRIEQREGPCV